jgi:hypothetical protein
VNSRLHARQSSAVDPGGHSFLFQPSPVTNHQSPSLQIRPFVFNHFQDAPPASSFFSYFCIAARAGMGPLPFHFKYYLNSTPLCPSSTSLLCTLPLFCFQQVTTVKFSKSRVLITIQNARGVGSPRCTGVKVKLELPFTQTGGRRCYRLASRGWVACRLPVSFQDLEGDHSWERH